MGGGDAPLDPQLRVRGVEGLRVADTSIMPTIVSGNTNAPAMVIGLRAAEIILQVARAAQIAPPDTSRGASMSAVPFTNIDKLYIAGRWHAADAREPVLNPATEEIYRSSTGGDVATANAALAAAREAFDTGTMAAT